MPCGRADISPCDLHIDHLGSLRRMIHHQGLGALTLDKLWIRNCLARKQSIECSGDQCIACNLEHMHGMYDFRPHSVCLGTSKGIGHYAGMHLVPCCRSWYTDRHVDHCNRHHMSRGTESTLQTDSAHAHMGIAQHRKTHIKVGVRPNKQCTNHCSNGMLRTCLDNLAGYCIHNRP